MADTLLQVVDALYPQSPGATERYTWEVTRALGGAVLTLTPHPDPAAEPAWEGLRVFAPAPNEGALAAWHRCLSEVEPAAVFVQHLGAAHPGMLLDLRERGVPYAVFLHDFGPLCPTLRLWHRRQELCSGPGRTGLKCAFCVSGAWRRAAELPLRALLYRHRPQDWRTALLRAEVLVAPSRFARDFWIGQGAPPERIAVIAPVLEPGSLSPSELPSGDPGLPAAHERRLLYPGGYDEASGIELLAAALDQIRAPVQLVAAGADSEQAREQMRAVVPKRHSVMFASVAPEAMPALASGCAAVVVPARWDMPYGHAVHLAQASGARAVATAVGGLTEQIIHGVNGYLAAPDDAAALAESLEEALRAAAGGENEAWAGATVGANARLEARRSLQAIEQLWSLLAHGASSDPAIVLEHGEWLDTLPGGGSPGEKSEALISALRMEGIGGTVADPSLRRRARAVTRARRVQLNHAVAFFRGSGCNRVVHLGDPDPAPDALAWFEAWGLSQVPESGLPDAVFEDRGEYADAEWLHRRFPQARAWASATPSGVETKTWSAALTE